MFVLHFRWRYAYWKSYVFIQITFYRSFYSWRRFRWCWTVECMIYSTAPFIRWNIVGFHIILPICWWLYSSVRFVWTVHFLRKHSVVSFVFYDFSELHFFYNHWAEKRFDFIKRTEKTKKIQNSRIPIAAVSQHWRGRWAFFNNAILCLVHTTIFINFINNDFASDFRMFCTISIRLWSEQFPKTFSFLKFFSWY